MNEKLQYASMLELPVSSSTITVKPIKKKKVKKRKDLSPEVVKQELLDKINSETVESASETDENGLLPVADSLLEKEQEAIIEETSTATVSKKVKKPFKFSVIGVQLALVVLLIGVIALTNVLNANSGLNVFMKSLFSPAQTVSADLREFNSFVPVLAFDEELILSDDGILTVSGEGSVYSPCNGVISMVTSNEDGSFTVEIAHSENFSTRIEGLTYLYQAEGDTVYSNIPVGYMKDFETSFCFLGIDGAVITGYEVVDGTVIWAV